MNIALIAHDAKKKLMRIPECHRSFMTTIPEEDVDRLMEQVESKLRK